jgi:hypothetical protein
MADADVAITAGTGTKIDTRTVGAGTDEHRQVVVIGDPSTAANVASADATNGLDVDVTRMAALVTGSAIIGRVGIDQTTPGTTNLVALAANQSVNVAQINGVTTTMGNGASGTGVQRVTIANDSTGVVTLTAGTATNEVVGDVAEDAALAGNPVRTAVRGHSGVPTAMSASNDAVTPWADLSGAQAVIPQPRLVDIQGVSNLGTSTDYTALDYMGSVITFTSVALASGRPLQIVGATILDRAIQSVALTLLLFRASPTVASADNAALSITAANASTARFLGAIKWAAADYVGATSCSMANGTVQGGPASIPIVTSGSANIYGVLVAGGTYNAAAAGDLEINLVCTQF